MSLWTPPETDGHAEQKNAFFAEKWVIQMHDNTDEPLLRIYAVFCRKSVIRDIPGAGQPRGAKRTRSTSENGSLRTHDNSDEPLPKIYAVFCR